MRFGVTDFRAAPRHLSVERSVAEVLTHPKYRHTTVYYDVGVAVAGQIKANQRFCLKELCLGHNVL